MFSTHQKFACRLWRHYDASPILLWQLGLCDVREKNYAAWVARVQHLSRLLTPATLLAASLAVSPENGKTRLREATVFEERVLQILDHSGQWK
jgi:hypothetical protein